MVFWDPDPFWPCQLVALPHGWGGSSNWLRHGLVVLAEVVLVVDPVSPAVDVTHREPVLPSSLRVWTEGEERDSESKAGSD